MPVGYLFPGKAWRPGSLKYGKVRIFSLATLTPLLTYQHAAPQFLDNWQSISPSHHWTEAQGTDLPSLSTFDTPPLPPLWTQDDLSWSSFWWLNILSVTRGSVTPTPRDSLHLSRSDSNTVCTHLSHPILSPCWYLIHPWTQLDTTPHSPTLPFNCYVLNYMGKATIC